jgi:hypothetical protein
MRKLLVCLLLLQLGQPLWALGEEKSKPPEEETQEGEGGSQINIDDPGGPPAAMGASDYDADSDSLPDAASPLPLIALAGVLSLAAAIAMWVRRNRTTKG